tara:strand:+ start:113 stop:721 length:609 start_codon:yes stop_codon:yes gene_type:complete
MEFRLFLFILNIIFTNSLVDNFGSINNNYYIKFKQDKNPGNDLTRISPSVASVISKQWLDNIISDVWSTYNNDYKLEKIPNKLLELQNMYIVKSINNLENYITDHRNFNDIYLSWMPASYKNNKIELFIVAGQLDTYNNIFVINQIVQSPLWDNRQIPSYKLKDALLDFTKELESSTIDLSPLYDHDIRYKLSWSTWCLESN